MRNLITDTTVVFLGLILPLCGWVWIALCKYVLHFRKGCNNRRCWYRCKKCPYLHSEGLEMRIKVLEHKQVKDPNYIALLRKQLQVYLDNPKLDRETEREMIYRLAGEAKRKDG